MAANQDLCGNCCAPRQAGYAACKYCKTPFVQNAQTQAIPCAKCGTLNEMGAQKCVQCQTWIVVQCIFCHGLSPHNAAACVRCNEPFAGAPERFQQRQQQVASQRNMQMVGTVGTVAASLVGAAAGAMFAGRSHGGYHHYDNGPHYAHRRDDHGGHYDDNGNYGDAGGGGGGLMDAFGGGGDSGGATGDYGGDYDTSNAGGGGGLMDAFTGGGDSGGDYDAGDSGGDGGGLMDSLFDGGSDD
jgi:hypothetical protein